MICMTLCEINVCLYLDWFTKVLSPKIAIVFATVNRAFTVTISVLRGRNSVTCRTEIVTIKCKIDICRNTKIRYGYLYSNALPFKIRSFSTKWDTILCFCLNSMWWRHNEATSFICLRPSIGELTSLNNQSKHT